MNTFEEVLQDLRALEVDEFIAFGRGTCKRISEHVYEVSIKSALNPARHHTARVGVENPALAADYNVGEAQVQIDGAPAAAAKLLLQSANEGVDNDGRPLRVIAREKLAKA